MERLEEDSVAQGDLSYRGLALGVSSRSVSIRKGDTMAIKREKIQPQGIHVSMVDGKARYTQVVTVTGTGKMIFVAGQLARNAQGVCVGSTLVDLA